MAMTVVPLYAYPVSVSPIQLGQLLDAVPAGFPSPGQDYDAGPIDLTELLIDDQAATFLVRITGTSMIGAGIYDGDVAIVDRSKSPRSGDVVVAILDGDFTIKKAGREILGLGWGGMRPGPSWQMQRSMLSKRATTHWDELIVARA